MVIPLQSSCHICPFLGLELSFYIVIHLHCITLPCSTFLQRIPETFVRMIRDELSAVATLTVPDGHVWRVGLRKADNKFWFEDGWQGFLEHYSIRVGYLLVFRYEGNSSFCVFIFNLNTSEINYQSAALSNNQRNNYSIQNRIFEEMEDYDIPEAIPSNQSMNSGSLRNKLFGDEWNLHQSKSASTLQAEYLSTRDIGVQFSAVEVKKSADEVRFQNLGDDAAHRVKKSGSKKRKIESSKLLSYCFTVCTVNV